MRNSAAIALFITVSRGACFIREQSKFYSNLFVLLVACVAGV